jgi:hypothetical protein
MLDIIIGAAFNHETGAIGTISKEAVFREFTDPQEGKPAETLESAEIALAVLVNGEMIEVAGDQITIPPRFIPAGAHDEAIETSPQPG